MTYSITKAAEARQLLVDLRQILVDQGEANWRRGIEAAIGELSNSDGSLNASGFGAARSIYNTMMAGGRGFAEYYISKASEDERIAANDVLDDLRSKTWSVFDL